jgi:branched-chain amino acid transport system substrate-binding protein
LVEGNVNTTRVRKHLAIAAAAAMLAVAGHGAALAADPPKEPVRLGGLLPLTGASATFGVFMAHACQAYADKVNAAGGINGHKIELIIEDDQYDPALTIAGARKLIERDHVQAISCFVGAGLGLAIDPFVEEKGIPTIVPAEVLATSAPPRKYLFATMEPWSISVTLLLQYSIDTLHKNKIAVLYSSDQGGQDINAVVGKYLAGRGLKPVITLPIDTSATDVSSQALNVKQTDADLVLIQVFGTAGTRLVQEFAKQGYAPQIVGMTAFNDPTTIKLMGAAGDGIIAFATYYPPDADKPGMADFREQMHKYYPKDPLGLNAEMQWSAMAVMTNAIAKIDGPITSQSIFAMLESGQTFDQVVGPPVKWASFATCATNPLCRRGPTQAYLVQIRNGTSKPVTEMSPPVAPEQYKY